MCEKERSLVAMETNCVAVATSDLLHISYKAIDSNNNSMYGRAGSFGHYTLQTSSTN